jgi:hypothetical protein
VALFVYDPNGLELEMTFEAGGEDEEKPDTSLGRKSVGRELLRQGKLSQARLTQGCGSCSSRWRQPLGRRQAWITLGARKILLRRLLRNATQGHNVPNVMNLTDSYIPNPFNQVISLFVQVAMTADRRGAI